MVAMRYNPMNDKWQYTSYVHVNGKTIKGKSHNDSEVILEAERGESIYAWISIDYQNKVYELHFGRRPGQVEDTVMIHFDHQKKLAKRLGMYFGSNLKAPSRFSIYKTKIWRWLGDYR